ncbi:hypothetical protein MIND_00022300 [Mycena indigotica]|uniref:Uncharacterized protein n=1 Tax=Mycena indigotica TaxID=2126181 RepID=A0A8H6TCT5_9AGAR|nr:uncharacterized protein MIND_00022300 [Mycena indigotica]KAF7315081.1 hypothetical protein MIND_00022300 [Mycena indigotica]
MSFVYRNSDKRMLDPNQHSDHGIGAEAALKQLTDKLVEYGLDTPERVAELQSFMVDYTPRTLTVLLGAIESLKKKRDDSPPLLVHEEPPEGVDELFYVDFPNSELRLLYHRMYDPQNRPDTPRYWQFYVRSRTSQPLARKPLVEMECVGPGDWHITELYLARPDDVLRIDKRHIFRLPRLGGDAADIPSQRLR